MQHDSYLKDVHIISPDTLHAAPCSTILCHACVSGSACPQ